VILIQKKLFIIILSLIVSVFFLNACAAKNEGTAHYQGEGTVLRKIAVVPFQKLEPADGKSRIVRCPIGGAMYTACDSSSGAEGIVQEIFLEKIKERKKIALMVPDRVEAVYNRLVAASMTENPQLVLKKIGEELGADGVVVGYLSCFRERKGYAVSAEKPAAVSFGIYLIRVSDGQVVWSNVFDKQQTYFMENLFQVSTFYRHGLKWMSAKELSEAGMEEILESFPGGR
jgi:hypothetical protein